MFSASTRTIICLCVMRGGYSILQQNLVVVALTGNYALSSLVYPIIQLLQGALGVAAAGMLL